MNTELFLMILGTAVISTLATQGAVVYFAARYLGRTYRASLKEVDSERAKRTENLLDIFKQLKSSREARGHEEDLLTRQAGGVGKRSPGSN
jgi:hypothetical protein